MHSIVFVKAGPEQQFTPITQLSYFGFNLFEASTPLEALQNPASSAVSAILVQWPIDSTVIAELQQCDPAIPVVLIADPLHLVQVPASLAKRAVAWLPSGAAATTIGSVLTQIVRTSGKSNKTSSFTTFADLASRLAETAKPLLLVGETGTGKLTLAQTIHGNSKRTNFTSINCAEINASELEAKLFALTDASSRTVYLESIEALPEFIQQRLAGWIKAGMSFALIASTTIGAIHLHNALIESFDGNVISLPPLRERTGDIAALADAMLAELMLPSPVKFSEEALGAMRAYDWPGNMDELRSVVEASAKNVGTIQILPADLPTQFASRLSQIESAAMRLPAQGINLDALEKELLACALERFKGNQTHAAKFLGLSRKTLIYRMEKHNLATTFRTRTSRVATQTA